MVERVSVRRIRGLRDIFLSISSELCISGLHYRYFALGLAKLCCYAYLDAQHTAIHFYHFRSFHIRTSMYSPMACQLESTQLLT
jgi:hypothetical protein